jgi:RecA/RadA recombinase
VAYTDGELDEMDAIREERHMPKFTAEERAEMQTQIGEILLVQGVIADHGLDIVNEILASGAFQLVVINSLGVFETAAKDGTDSLEEHAAQSSEAQLLSRFIPKMFMHLNRPLGDGSRNETTILAANQVRANRDLPRMRPGMQMPAHMKYQPGSGSRALAHGKAIDLLVHKGHDIVDKEMDPPVMIGREVPWVIYKGKLGTHDGIKGSYNFYFDGGADRAASLLSTATRYGVIEQAGAWYSFNTGPRATGPTMKAQGEDAAVVKLADPALFQAIYDATVKAAGVLCRYK